MMSKNSTPWSKEHEKAVLGAILYDEAILPEVASILNPDDFYATKHKLIYQSMIELHEGGSKVDSLTVFEELKEAGKLEKVDIGHYLTGLSDSCPTAANAPEYARKVYDYSQRRKLLELFYKGYNGSPEDKANAVIQIREYDFSLPWEKDQQVIKTSSFEAIINDPAPPPLQLISRGLLPAQSILLLTGAPKAGKSILALNIGLCLASGEDWHQFKIERPVRVLVIQAEVVYWALKTRLEKMKAGCEFPVPKDSFFVSDPIYCDIRSDEGYALVTETISRIAPEVVIFDPLLHFHSEEENANSAMGRVMAKFRELTFLGISVILVHHSRKYSDDSTISNARGASAIAGAVDSVMEFKKKDISITATFDLRYDEAPNEMNFKLNPETLWLERHSPELEEEHNSAIMEMLQGTGTNGKPLVEIVGELVKKFDKSESTVRNWVKRLSEVPGHIITISGKGNSKQVFFTYNMK